MTTSQTPLRDAAVAIARVGWRIVPLPAGMKKAPPTGWPDLATNDTATVAQCVGQLAAFKYRDSLW